MEHGDKGSAFLEPPEKPFRRTLACGLVGARHRIVRVDPWERRLPPRAGGAGAIEFALAHEEAGAQSEDSGVVLVQVERRKGSNGRRADLPT